MTIDVSGDGAPECDTKGGSSTCTIDPGTTFTVVVNLDKISVTNYDGFRAKVENSSNINQVDTSGTDEIVWPDSATPGPEVRSSSSVTVSAAASSPSTFTGALAEFQYVCKFDGLLTLVHNSTFGTFVDSGADPVTNDSDGASESVAITCGEEPTETPTRTPTRTPTQTPTPPPTGEEPCPDFDGDGVITVRDLVQVARRMGTAEGDPRYDSMFDLNEDGSINVVDLATVVHRFGEPCP